MHRLIASNTNSKNIHPFEDRSKIIPTCMLFVAIWVRENWPCEDSTSKTGEMSGAVGRALSIEMA